MTCKQILSTLLVVGAGVAACGNYSNDDLEFMNAVPARQDFVAFIPRDLTPANEAELAKDTHNVIAAFNGALDFLKVADAIRAYPPTSRIPDGRVWGPVADANHPGWRWQFVMQRDPNVVGRFNYHFDEQPIGAGDQWATILSGGFLPTGGGARRGVGDFTLQTDAAHALGFPFDYGADGSLLQRLDVNYSTADYPITVAMTLRLYPNASLGDFTTTSIIYYTYEAQENGQGAMLFDGTDSTGKNIKVDSHWLGTGRGRADATYVDPTNGVNLTWTECWDDSFVSVYDNKPWAMPPDPVTTGDASLCPDIPTP